MADFITSFYTTGGLKNMVLCEFIRGFSWACGAFVFVVLVYLTIIKRMM